MYNTLSKNSMPNIKALAQKFLANKVKMQKCLRAITPLNSFSEFALKLIW